jgi:antirestriction protein ArdC
MATQTEIRQAITDRIIEALQNGSIPPWRRPWLNHENSGLPTNVISKKRYSGINPILLQMASMRHGFTSKFWGTFKQWQDLGGRVMKRPDNVPPGQWGTTVIFFKPITKTEIDKDTGEEEEIKFGVLKTYCVFNADQVEGEHLDRYRVGELTPESQFVDYEPAEDAIMATGANICFGGDRAFYARPTPSGDGDYIQLPPKSHFTERKEYYATALHELTHWSEVRTNWTGSYAEGELRAEIAACYMLTELGVPQSDDLTNHHAYLEHWLKALRSDPRSIFSCATAATKAADFVLGFSRTLAEEPAGEEVLAD